MTSHNQAAHDRYNSEAHPAFMATLAPRTNAMSIAWDVAAECLGCRDTAGFDAAMQIFKRLQKERGL